MKHKEKQTLARKIRTHEELKAKTPIFQTEAWDKRKENIKKKVLKVEKNRKKTQ